MNLFCLPEQIRMAIPGFGEEFAEERNIRGQKYDAQDEHEDSLHKRQEEADEAKQQESPSGCVPEKFFDNAGHQIV